MTTLLELKTKYQEIQAAEQREYAAREQAREDHQQEVLAELFLPICTYLAERESVDRAELVQYGRIEGDWYSSGQLNYVTFHLELPGHQVVSLRISYPNDLPNNDRAEWRIDNYNNYQQLGEALIRAEWLYRQQKADEEHDVQRQAERRQVEVVKAIQAKRQNAAKQRVFDQIASDPAALLLLKLFVQIQHDRDALNDQIESLEEANANADYWHGEELATAQRKAEQAQRDASEAVDRTRSLEYEIDDLESKLKKVQRSGCW